MAVAVAIIVVMAVAGVALYFLTPPSSPSDVKFGLAFTPNAYSAPFYYGQAQGIYRQHGVNITIFPAKNGGTVIPEVSVGQLQFGFSELSNVVQAAATANITNVKVVAVLLQKPAFGVIYNEADIHSFADLAGKVGAGNSPNSSLITPLFYYFAQRNGLSLSSLNMQYSTAPVHNPQLVQGKIDFELTGVHALPALQAQASVSGIKLGIFDYSDYLDSYGLALFTNTEMLQQHSGVVKSFVQATMQSWWDSFKDPAAAVSALTSAEPQLEYNQTLAGFQLDIKCCGLNITGLSSPLQMGWMDPARVQTTVSIATAALGLPASVNASSLYTDAYVTPP